MDTDVDLQGHRPEQDPLQEQGLHTEDGHQDRHLPMTLVEGRGLPLTADLKETEDRKIVI